MSEQSNSQIKADAINEFVCSIIGALESGFIDSDPNSMTIAELHRVAQCYVEDLYGVKLPHIVEQWGIETARLCGYTGKTEVVVHGE
ncbi:hypothetical protein [Agarilytica rhodophyticola]|uniref:hypothetical protein n=1 Tax=Agarilytica rhodophyticola TaxID=1737490 RepID=UPI000B3425D4|nr:hypothetical protein [Agarilytica rhodophyticola]